MSVPIERVIGELPACFATLRAEARAEGHRHLERLATDWADGAIRFERQGEALLTAWLREQVVGIGGITIDPVEVGALRLRRFYVSKTFRRRGVARALAGALLARALMHGRPVLVNAAAGSEAFWEALGFIPDPRSGHTHRLQKGEGR